MRDLKVGAAVRLTVFREGRTRDLECTLPERPLLPGDMPGPRSSFVPQRAPNRVDSTRYRL
jgi:hypothetical protein